MDIKERKFNTVEELMGEIIKFPVNQEDTDKLILLVANNAITDSTNELLIDFEEIEKRLSDLRKYDTMENRILLISGLCFFNDAYVVGEDDDWEKYKMQGTKVKSYAVFTNLNKMPKKLVKERKYTEKSFRTIVDKLNKKYEKYEIYINPEKDDGYIFTSDLIKVFFDLIDKAVKFADDRMKEGYKGEELTAIMFEKFDFRNVEITLKNGNKIKTQVQASTFGDEPNARYTYLMDGEEKEVLKKDIIFIKEI